MARNISKFRNTEYVYNTPDDSILIRGLQINSLIDQINESQGDNYVENISAGIVYSIPVGSVRNDRAIFIDYALTNGSLYRAGTIKIINRETSVGFNNVFVGDTFALTFSASISGDIILLTLTTDAGEGLIDFSYIKQIIKKNVL